MICRHCSAPQTMQFLDLGFQPLSNAYVPPEALSKAEITYPLRLRVCESCWLVQTEDYISADEIFTSDYAYFSSTSQDWVEHAKNYCVNAINRFKLDGDSIVVEVASNDGYLLRNFVAAGIPCIGIEPTDSTAAAAEKVGVPTLRRFFGTELAYKLVHEGKAADLIIGNNVYAHTPDINDFTNGITKLLKPDGIVTLEFPHLMRLVEFSQFDTVYHEHFSYLSLLTVKRIFAQAGLRVFDVEELSTHGGSLRIYGCKIEAPYTEMENVRRVSDEELARGMKEVEFYAKFQSNAEKVKNELLRFLLKIKADGHTIAAYGAAAKGNTILNFAGVKSDLLPFVCDAAAAKQGKYLPGSHIPILPPAELVGFKPDFVLILPWNLSQEIQVQLADLEEAGTRFVTAVPHLEISGL